MWADNRNILEQDYDMLEIERDFYKRRVEELLSGLGQMVCAESSVVRDHVIDVIERHQYKIVNKSDVLGLTYSEKFGKENNQ